MMDYESNESYGYTQEQGFNNLSGVAKINS